MTQWLVIASKPNQETRAEINLRRQAFDVYYPRINIMGKVKALFPSYLFVRLEEKDLSAIPNTFGVRNMIRIGENLATVPNDTIDSIKTRAAKDGVLRECPFKPGDQLSWGNIPVMFDCMVDDDRCRVLFSMLGRVSHKVLYLRDLAA